MQMEIQNMPEIFILSSHRIHDKGKKKLKLKTSMQIENGSAMIVILPIDSDLTSLLKLQP